MTTFMRRLALPLFLSLLCTGLLVGCDSSDPEEPIMADSIDGAWQGEVYSRNVMGEQDTFRVAMTVTVSMSNVSGNGTVTAPPGRTPASIDFVLVEETSSYLHPLLALDLIYGGSFPGDLNGNVSADRREVRGTMSGPGFSGLAELQFVLTRIEPRNQ